MNARTFLIPLLCLGAVAFAYGPRSRSEASLVTSAVAKTTASTPRARKLPKVVGPVVGGDMAVAMEGSTVRFTLDVSNTGSKYVELAFPDGQTHDFAIMDAAGRQVYRWGATRMFTQAVQNKLLEAGSSMHIVERAAPSLPPGEYVAVATLHSTNYPLERRTAFSVR